MRENRTVSTLIVLSLLVPLALVTACASSKQARDVEEKPGVLFSDYSKFKEGKEGEGLLVYKANKVDFNAYTNFVISPVIFSSPADASEIQAACAFASSIWIRAAITP